MTGEFVRPSRRKRGSWAVSVVLLSGCGAGLMSPAEHEPDMPEVALPVVQTFEDGPVSEVWVEGAGLLAFFGSEDGAGALSAPLTLAGAASRTTVWLTLSAADGPPPKMQVQAGWTNGQTGPWVDLAPVWAEGPEHVLAADLHTAATRLRLRLEPGQPAGIEALRWAANVPLAPAVRAGTLQPQSGLPDSVALPASSFAAQPAACGEADVAATQVVLHRLPAGPPAQEPDRFLRALQAFDQLGLHWCDLRSNYVVGAGPVRTARGARRAAMAPTQNDNWGRVAVAVLGCEAGSQQTRAQLSTLLDALTQFHGLDSAAQFSVAASGPCPQAASAWLDEALADWLTDAPFVTEPVPVPPTTTGTITGRVFDEPSGDAVSGQPIAGAEVRGPGGAVSITDADGRFVLAELPQGSQSLVASKTGWLSSQVQAEVRAGEVVEVSIGLQPEPPPPPTGVSVIDQSFLIQHFGGTVTDPLQFPETQDGFQAYLDAVGVTHFAAWEYVVPNNPSVATGCGYTILLPERAMWPRAGALGLLADRLRQLVNEPVTLRNWWRPPCYNEGVGGAPGGDHPDADALDLDFRSARSRADAQRFLCETYWLRDIVAPEDIAPGSNLNPRLNMSIGLGGETIHLGLLSRNGRRYWQYSSYTNQSNSGSCW